jgi:hypothetical protein
MIDRRASTVGLGILQNVIDIVVAFVLVLGGWNATNSHPFTGFMMVVFAPFLLYLSSGVWTKDTWKLISRLALYTGLLFVLGVSVAALLIFHAFPSVDGYVIYVVLGALLVVVLLSMAQLRLVRRENLARSDSALTRSAAESK